MTILTIINFFAHYTVLLFVLCALLALVLVAMVIIHRLGEVRAEKARVENRAADKQALWKETILGVRARLAEISQASVRNYHEVEIAALTRVERIIGNTAISTDERVRQLRGLEQSASIATGVYYISGIVTKLTRAL